MAVPLLFSPGPVIVEDNVRNSLLHYDICHRGKEFESMFDDTRKKICKLFGADETYESVIVSGSGTSANETVLSSIFKKDEEVLLISNGMFGERLEEIIDMYNIPMIKPAFAWASVIDIDIIEKAIIDNPKISVVAMVFHETSTAMINPVYEIGQLCKKHKKIFFVDSVSAAGGQHIDVADNNIDITTSVGGKCVGAFPGSAFICAKTELLESLRLKMCKNVYLNLYKHYKIAKEKSQTPNTPNLTLFWALNQAITNILEIGLDKQIEKYKKHASIIRNGVRKLGLKILLPDEIMSNTVTSVFLPKGMDVKKFIADMENDGFILYPGKGDYLAAGLFQIANMGAIKTSDCYRLLDCIAQKLGK